MGNQPRRDGVALVPLVLSVERVGKAKEDIGVVGERVLRLQTTTDDSDFSEVFVLGQASAASWSVYTRFSVVSLRVERKLTFFSRTVYIILMNSAHSSVCSR